MKFVDLKTKDRAELERLVRTAQDELRELRFRVHRGEEKDVRRIRELRTEIARLLTAVHQ